ncbi:olfactory receptor 143-like [Ammospiza caudacuta]|uniref:olfactory receptor 143-like n=1 Tax=Ammospiza caudacuta TaxID=2857398 RepID=UPI002739A186|nr:olfactory receptor 143-like [Ammospiza caudacuta]
MGAELDVKISYTGCAAQLFFFLFFISAEYFLLTIISHDRYMSVCKPLSSVLYSVVPPAPNPLIYSRRNQELKAAHSHTATQLGLPWELTEGALDGLIQSSNKKIELTWPHS